MKPLSHRRAFGLCVALLTAAMLGMSCSSLPTIVPDLAQGPARPVPISGAHGPLSAAQSRAILQRLQRGGQPTGIFERHLAVEEAIAGSPLTTGNRVLLLQDGPATYRAMLAAMPARATTSTWRPTSWTTTRSASASCRR
jgi:cardiolipin synthase